MSWFDDNAPTGGGTMTGGPVASQPGPGTPTGGGQNFGNLSSPSAWMALVNNPTQLRAWVSAQAPQLFANNPGLLDYYVSKVQGQPGANPTEQAGSAQYWTNKILQDPGITGQSGGGSAGGASGSPGGIPGMDPGYNFRFNQGVRALQASAAARGTLLTGGTLKALALFGQDAASQEYANAFGRQLSLAQLGENAAAGQGNFGQNYANSASNTLQSNANAQGAAGIAQGNLYNNLAGNLGGLGLYASGYHNPTNPASSGVSDGLT